MGIVKITIPLEEASQDRDGFYTCGNYIACVDPVKPNGGDVTVIAIVKQHTVEIIREYVIRERLSEEEWKKKLTEIAQYYNIEKGN